MKKILLTLIGIEAGFFVVSLCGSKLFGSIDNYYLYNFCKEALLAVYAIVLLVALKRADVLKFRVKGIGAGLAAGSYVLVVNVLLPLLGFAAMQITGTGIAADPISATGTELLLFALYALMIGITEEVLYRGILQNTVLDHTGRDTVTNVRKGLLLSGIFFGLIHLPNILSGESLTGVLTQVVGAIPLGIVFGAVYFRSRDNLWIGVILHALVDASAFMISGMLSGVDVTEGLDKIGAAKMENGVGSFLVSLALSAAVAAFLIRKKVIAKAIEARREDA